MAAHSQMFNERAGLHLLVLHQINRHLCRACAWVTLISCDIQVGTAMALSGSMVTKPTNISKQEQSQSGARLYDESLKLHWSVAHA